MNGLKGAVGVGWILRHTDRCQPLPTERYGNSRTDDGSHKPLGNRIVEQGVQRPGYGYTNSFGRIRQLGDYRRFSSLIVGSRQVKH